MRPPPGVDDGARGADGRAQRLGEILDQHEIRRLLQPAPAADHDLRGVEPGDAGPLRRRLEKRDAEIVGREGDVERLDLRLSEIGLRFGEAPGMDRRHRQTAAGKPDACQGAAAEHRTHGCQRAILDGELDAVRGEPGVEARGDEWRVVRPAVVPGTTTTDGSMLAMACSSAAAAGPGRVPCRRASSAINSRSAPAVPHRRAVSAMPEPRKRPLTRTANRSAIDRAAVSASHEPARGAPSPPASPTTNTSA